MAMTKKERRTLEGILSNLERACNYIDNDKIAGIAQRLDRPGNGGEYTLNNLQAADVLRMPEYIAVTHKYIGSDITGLWNARAYLRSFLHPEDVTQ